MSLYYQNLQQANAQLVSELHISKDQLSSSQANVAALNDLNFTLDNQNQALTVELITERGKLQHVEVQAKSDIARLATEVERLHGRNRQWISRMLALDEGKQKVMDGLRSARDITASRLEHVKQELSMALDKIQDLEVLATYKEARIMELTGQLARTTNASSPTAQKSNDVPVRENTSKTQDNSISFVKDFDRRRMFFENAQRVVSTAAPFQAGPSATIRVRPMVKRLEDGLSPIPIETGQDTKALTRLRVPLEGSPLRRSPGMRLTTLVDPVGTRELEHNNASQELFKAKEGGFSTEPPWKMVFDSIHTGVAKDDDEGSQADLAGGVGEVDETDAALLGYDMVDDGYLAAPSDSTHSSSTAPSSHQRHKLKGSVRGTLKRVGGLKKNLSGGIALSILTGSTPLASASASVDAHGDSNDQAKRFFSKLKKRLGERLGGL
ncbi:hypothetical protein FRC02_007229 [Tulasnella sp. 418]|nr:hypothetical protein FRC02_007229 [Tulasnella sp. 418]